MSADMRVGFSLALMCVPSLTFRQRADDVLKNAKQVKQALDDADTAQEKAVIAIEVAKNNINLADSDLKQVGSKRECVGISGNNCCNYLFPLAD